MVKMMILSLPSMIVTLERWGVGEEARSVRDQR